MFAWMVASNRLQRLHQATVDSTNLCGSGLQQLILSTLVGALDFFFFIRLEAAMHWCESVASLQILWTYHEATTNCSE